MRILLLGSGGREHALARAFAADPDVTALIAAPGNPGVGEVAMCRPDVAVDDIAAVTALAAEVDAELAVVGPEAPLVAGVVDALQAKGIACFGPTAAAAELEGSKAFAKEVMAAAGVPTARSRVAADPAAVASALDELGPPYVVKQDGLAAGKGVVVTDDREAALAHAARCGRVVIEEYLDGPEVSVFAICDGTTAVPLLPAQDFKRLADGDTGPNTGGMGAYTPLPWAPSSLVDDVMRTVVHPTLAEMARRGRPYRGVLYAGLVLTARGVRVVEFNCRLGDPETQVLLPLLATPLARVCHAAATGELASLPPLRWHRGAAVTVVIASAGYPAAPQTGDVITGADRPGVLHAGTARREDGALVSAGGRVLACTGTGSDLAAARAAAYELVDGVTLAGAQHRTDIARAAVRGELSPST